MRWDKKPLSEIITFKGGGTPKKDVAEYWGDEIPWATVKDFKSLELSETIDSISRLGLEKSASNLIPAGHVIIPTRMGLGKAAINSIDLAINQDLRALEPKVELNNRYLLHSMIGLGPEIERNGSGATVKGITQDRLYSLKIPLPPLEEQKRIAKILDAADALRAKRRQAITQLDTFLQSTFIDLFGDPVTNPKGWDECNVGEVTDCIVPGRDKPKSFSGETPWVTTDGLLNLGYTTTSTKGMGLTEEEIKEVKAKIIPLNSVIFSCVGDLGIISINTTELVVNQQLHTFQCPSSIIPEFLMFYLPFRKPWMFKRATQTTLPYLNKTNCNSIPIFVPPLELQQRFASIVESVEKEKSKMQAHLIQLDTLFASLQQRAFKGEL